MAIFVLFICGMHYLYRGLKKEDYKEKIIMIGFASLFFGQALIRFFFYFSDFYVEGNYTGHAYYGDYASQNISTMYITLVLCGYISFLVGIAIFLFCFEIVTKKTKFMLTLYNAISIVLLLALPLEYKRTLMYILVFVNALLLILILFWFSKKSSKEFQAVSTLMMIGFILYILGAILDASTIKELGIYSPTIPAVLMIIGALVAISPTIINPKILSQTLVNWFIFLIFISTLVGIGLNFVINRELPLTVSLIIWIMILLGIAIDIYILIRFIKFLRPPEVIEKKIEKREEGGDFLKIFAKPQRITEEEVTFHREQKICLVCKGKVGGFNFICPECNALYCQKCARTLSNLENACWVCESPFDKSKPVKLLPKSEKEDRTLKTHKTPK